MKQNNSLSVRALPSFIDVFNGIYGFATGIQDIFNMIFGTDTGGLTLEEVLKNQDLLNEISGKLDGINGDLSEIIAQGNLNTELTKELLRIANEQNNLLTDVNNKLNAINAMLNTYLPKITNMLSDIMKQNYVLSLQIEYLSKQLQEISDKLDVINLNVLINSTLTEITPAYQRIKYVNEKFDDLTLAAEKTLRAKQGSFNEDIFDNDTLENLTELTELAKSVTKNDVDSFEFYLHTFHDVLIGNNLFGRSALKTAAELITKDEIKTSGSEIGKVYSFLIVLTCLQAKAFLTLTACRKLLGLSDIDYTNILNQHLNDEKNEFRDNILPTLSNKFSNPTYAKTTGSDDDTIVVLGSDPGYALVGFEIISDPIPVLKVYQAKLKQNYQVDEQSLTEKVYRNINKIFFPEIFQGYYTKDIMFPNGYVITRIIFEKKYKSRLRYLVKANFYDSSTGDIDLTKSKEESSGDLLAWPPDSIINISEDDEEEKDVYMPLGVISETFLTPIHSFGLNVDEKSRIITLTGKSYLRECLLETDLVNKETSLIAPPNVFISNIVANWNIEADNLEPWVANNKNAYVDSTGGIEGSKALFTQGDGEFSQFIGDKLKPNTDYIIQYTVKGKPAIYLKNKNTGYNMYEDTNGSSEEFQTIAVNYTSETDPSQTHLVFKSQSGYEAWGDNFIIVESKPVEDYLKPEAPPLLKSENWILTGDAKIDRGILISESGNGGFKQFLQLESGSIYFMQLQVIGKMRVTIRNTHTVLFERDYSSNGHTMLEDYFTTVSEDIDGVFMEITSNSGERLDAGIFLW
ncbi:vegetative insecticidal protein Vip3A family protein [Paenibacillus thiaminolyticus]|uniref:vegetative insecticidal protein Vip3A family protein n=1 Tax=Paenibacillus thiaminolyticus TaxID=49283 RepID=UPI002542DB38|nr:vegetative insecticidal protein Vip3A family protein [Paenibacillus thiaminolyticus]WII39503.1 vegetative insecticidal protein Vip3A family protein [Paenibacillus thiaminolyticus]